ncbi:folylpolyglutamate synthase/dihydrofolate synthase family protein [Mailhella massiliensis]|uniref:Dihydrofolate synthase/folylpolyglutamate synthase n=1 Tax=Mailhella massiliensis TaxID=1903261 RepID=A0A921AU03_9BACT|nr:cyanophycin synthetase [Mailhella massiliensis]HJD96084.1 bifunctional folylpolyglutamate synthase/dihydrofolate synthase [Mailhella massiliensis]
MTDHGSCCCRLPESAPFHSYEEVLQHLDSLGLFHMDMGLGRMERALHALELDRLRCPAVQIVGTNGKGSTSVFLQSIAMAHGLNVGLYTSPHFVWPEERIRLNHTMLPRRVWPALAGDALRAEKGLTYFELLTVMAASAFQTSESDLAIFEAGLGGRYDATTALPVDMICFVPMGMDHMNVLGDSLAAIADDKSDALREGVAMAVSAPQESEARDILFAKADARQIPLCSCPTKEKCGGTRAGSALWESLPEELKACSVLPDDAILGLRGPHQHVNAQTAVLAWVLLCHRYRWKTDCRTIARGLRLAFIPGRLQYAPASGGHPALWLDGAHNTHGMKALLASVRDMGEEERPGAVVFSCLADKEPEKLTALVRELAGDLPLFVPTIKDNPRAAQGSALSAMLGPKALAVPGLKEALAEAEQAAGKRPVLVCGSLYLLSELFTLWPDLLEAPLASS